MTYPLRVRIKSPAEEGAKWISVEDSQGNEIAIESIQLSFDVGRLPSMYIKLALPMPGKDLKMDIDYTGIPTLFADDVVLKELAKQAGYRLILDNEDIKEELKVD